MSESPDARAARLVRVELSPGVCCCGDGFANTDCRRGAACPNLSPETGHLTIGDYEAENLRLAEETERDAASLRTAIATEIRSAEQAAYTRAIEDAAKCIESAAYAMAKDGYIAFAGMLMEEVPRIRALDPAVKDPKP